jgi:hypothetical protein
VVVGDWSAYGSKTTRLLILALQVAVLGAAWVLLRPANLSLLGYGLFYVSVMWAIACVITFGAFLGSSMAPLSNLLLAASRSSANAMWLVPAVLAMTTRSPILTVLGLMLVVNSTRLLALSRAPKGKAIPRRRVHPSEYEDDEPADAIFAPREAPQFSPETLPAMAGGLALQAGIYALYQSYPLPAAVSFAVVTVLWISTSLTHGAQHTRRTTTLLYSAPVAFLTLLLTVTFTAVLMNRTVVLEAPPPAPDTSGQAEQPGMTRRVLSRIAHVPPPPAVAPAPAGGPGGGTGGGEASKTQVAELVDPALRTTEKKMNKAIPGVVLRPQPMQVRKPPVVLSGARFHFTSGKQSLSFPFSGEYELFRLSSGSLPKGAPLEKGSPLDSLFGTTNGEPMETVAVQPFDPPLDLTNCGKVLVNVTSAEAYPVLVAMQLVTGNSVEDGGSDLLGMKGAREQMLEFDVPKTSRPLLVRAIRIAFQRPAMDNNTNVRILVKGFTLLTRGF